MAYPHTDILTQYTHAIAQIDGLEIKGKTVPYTSVNGYMSSFLDKEGQMGKKASLRLTIFLFRKAHSSLGTYTGIGCAHPDMGR